MGGKLWTAKEELYVKKYYNTKSISEIAKVLKRSYNAVQRKAQSLNLCVPKPTEHRDWTEEEELLLKLSEAEFAMHDISLYLDLHPKDYEMTEAFKKYARKYNDLIEIYQK